MHPIRSRLLSLASAEIGACNHKRYQGRPDFWCGAFVLWALREAGLSPEVPDGTFRPGRYLTNGLAPVDQPLPGDVVRFEKLEHYALFVGFTRQYMQNGHIWDSLPTKIRTVDGASYGSSVALCERVYKPRVTHFFSIESLIERYEWTGAPTGDVA